MGLSARLITYGNVGIPDPRGYSFSFQAAEAIRRAEKRNPLFAGVTVKNVFIAKTSDDDNEAALMLRYSMVFLDNATTDYIVDSGGSYFSDKPDPFHSGTSGVGFDLSEYGTVGQFRYGPSTTNKPFALRIRLAQPADGAVWPFYQVQRGKWILRFTRNNLTMMKKAPGWNQTDEDSLFALLGILEPTSGNLDDIQTLRETLYQYETDIQVDGEMFGQTHNIVIIPEPRGVINVGVQGKSKFFTRVVDENIVQSRADGELWHDGQITFRMNGVASFWQLGYPSFYSAGQLRLGKYQTATSGTWQYTLLGSNIVQTGVSATAEMVNEVIDAVWDELVVNFSSDNRGFTPFVYAGHALRSPGALDGDWQTVTFDSGDISLGSGCGIADATPTYEELHRRLSMDVTLLNVDGVASDQFTGTPNDRYPALENRVCDFYIGAGGGSGTTTSSDPIDFSDPAASITVGTDQSFGTGDSIHLNVAGSPGEWINGTVTTYVPSTGAMSITITDHNGSGTRSDWVVSGQRCVIRRGLITYSGHDAMRTVEDGLTNSEAMKGESRMKPQVCDQWAMLDATILEDLLPVGDGLYLGAYIRNCLDVMGLGNTDMAGVSATAGRLLPSARPGEPWKIQPSPGTSLGDWLRSVVELWGMRQQLWIDNTGTWNLGVPSTSVRYAFTTTSGANQIFNPISMARDFSSHANTFRAVGNGEVNGNPLVSEWVLWDGIQYSGGNSSLRYTGRVIRYPTVTDDMFARKSDCTFAARSLSYLHGKPGRYIAGEIFYKSDLFPGHYVTIDDVLCEVERIESGSIAFGSVDGDFAGKMSIVCREVA